MEAIVVRCKQVIVLNRKRLRLKNSIDSLVVNCGQSSKREYAGKVLLGVRLPSEKADFE